MKSWLDWSVALLACLTAAGACTAKEEATVAELQAQLLQQISSDAWETRGYTGRGVLSERVMAAMAEVPRHEFVDRYGPAAAYANRPLPIGHGQTISQPFIVALMTQAMVAEPTPSRVLEIGTGCGYQTAVLASLVTHVYTVERIEVLLTRARRRLCALGVDNVSYRHGDGSAGWPECEPFDGVLVTAAPPRVPERLARQLVMGGRLVIPVGDSGRQRLKVFTRTVSGLSEDTIADVSFVPMLRGMG